MITELFKEKNGRLLLPAYKLPGGSSIAPIHYLSRCAITNEIALAVQYKIQQIQTIAVQLHIANTLACNVGIPIYLQIFGAYKPGAICINGQTACVATQMGVSVTMCTAAHVGKCACGFNVANTFQAKSQRVLSKTVFKNQIRHPLVGCQCNVREGNVHANLVFVTPHKPTTVLILNQQFAVFNHGANFSLQGITGCNLHHALCATVNHHFYFICHPHFVKLSGKPCFGYCFSVSLKTVGGCVLCAGAQQERNCQQQRWIGVFWEQMWHNNSQAIKLRIFGSERVHADLAPALHTAHVFDHLSVRFFGAALVIFDYLHTRGR